MARLHRRILYRAPSSAPCERCHDTLPLPQLLHAPGCAPGPGRHAATLPTVPAANHGPSPGQSRTAHGSGSLAAALSRGRNRAPWYYPVCQLATVALGGYSFLVLGVLTLGTTRTLLDALAHKPVPGGLDLRDFALTVAAFQFAVYFGSALLTVVLTTLVLTMLDAGRRLREVSATLQRG
jgi:hypothetical protein